MKKKIGKRVFSIILSSLLVFQSSMTTVWAIGTESETGYQTETNSNQEAPVLIEENQVEETDSNKMESTTLNEEQTEETQETSASIEQDNEPTGEPVLDEQIAMQNLDSGGRKGIINLHSVM